MKTPIKSFEIIKEMYVYFIEHFRVLEPKLMICEKEDFDNVETTLKDYELMKEIRITARFDLAQVNKEHKALEIIKEKRVNVRAFLKCCHREDGLTIYNNQCDDKQEKESKELTQEEYDLLKEVLL